MHDVPEDLAAAVRRAATTAPAPGGDLDALRRRWRSRRRRRTAVTAGSVACLVALTAVGVPLVTDRLNPADRSAATVRPATPAERLLFGPLNDLLLSGDGREIRVVDTPPTITEINLDGSVVEHPLPENLVVVTGLSDGRLVGLTQPPMRLTVLRPDGSIEHSRSLGPDGIRIDLLDVTAREAYLLRNRDTIVAHDLTTGRERTVTPADIFPVGRILVQPYEIVLPPDQPTYLTLAGGPGLLSTWERQIPDGTPPGTSVPADRSRCGIHVVGLADQRQRGNWSVQGCGTVRNVRFSPDGRLLAVIYDQTSSDVSDESLWRVTVFDVATGEVRASQQLGRIIPLQEPLMHTWRDAMAWADNHTLRVGVPQVSENPNRLYRYDELLKVSTLTVQ
ncbi:hypothetical protein I0C86_37945 [Plantactinospora sp. S1510]|uniref:WD40 repeat domain-containing protein n=1 Tax=Plantactinospora alkalitolerans TaxID=2789879 RepID=A0ABS0H871_9ACTN|nr:hypothetical protein [Plantactinospora alkalitolerans]MBF9134672.1 hypothetical protein [Plantactinospora alkalitolerans]